MSGERLGRWRRDRAVEKLALFAALFAAACAPLAPAPVPSPEPTTVLAQGASEAVVYIKDGDILAWDEATGESRTIFDAGDVIRVEVSDDGQMLAFLRRSVVQTSDVDFHEQSAMWVVDLSGQNRREVVSAESLRELLGASETDSSNIPEMTWIPGTHRLLFNGWTYLVQAEGESHAIPRGLVSVDADDGTQQVVVPAEAGLRFVASPDGRQVALLSPTDLSFIDADGSDLRQDVLTYAQVGVPGPVFPTGVWTEDSQAFVVTGSIDENPAGIDFDLWRVPADGSAPKQLASVQRSHPPSVTFSPDGQFAAHIQYTDAAPPEIAGWFITPLKGEPGRWPFQATSRWVMPAFTGRRTEKHSRGHWRSSAPVPPRTVTSASRQFPGEKPPPFNGSTQPTSCCSPAIRRLCSS